MFVSFVSFKNVIVVTLVELTVFQSKFYSYLFKLVFRR